MENGDKIKRPRAEPLSPMVKRVVEEKVLSMTLEEDVFVVCWPHQQLLLLLPLSLCRLPHLFAPLHLAPFIGKELGDGEEGLSAAQGTRVLRKQH